jgi:low temperature requirement protein LtrA
VLCEYASPMFGFALPLLGRSRSHDWRSAEGGHLAERCQAFVMLALGESVVVTGATLSDTVSWSAPTVIAFLICFAGSVAMWWIYFDWGSRAGSHAIASSREPGMMGAYFHYVHVILVAGIIGSAAADDLVILHPDARIGTQTALLLIGGPALYVVGCGLYKRAIRGWLPLSHWVGLGLCVLIGPLAFHTDLLMTGTLTTLMMVVVAAWESVSRRQSAHARGLRAE